MHVFLINDEKFYIEDLCGDKLYGLAFLFPYIKCVCYFFPHTLAPCQFLTTFVFIEMFPPDVISSMFKYAFIHVTISDIHKQCTSL